MDTQRTFGMNKNLGLPAAAVIAFIGGIIEFSVIGFLINDVILSIVYLPGEILLNLVPAAVEVVLVACIFVVLLYLSVTTLSTKKAGFLLGAIVGLGYVTFCTYNYYGSLNDYVAYGYLDSGEVVQYLLSNLILLGSQLAIFSGAIGVGFVYLSQMLTHRGQSRALQSYLFPFLISLGIAFLFDVLYMMVVDAAADIQPSPYATWVIRGIFILLGAYAIYRVYRWMPDVTGQAAQDNDSGTYQAPVPVTVPVHVRASTPREEKEPVITAPAIPSPVAVTDSVADHKYCEQCGARNKLNAHFCSMCGNKL